MHSYKNILVVYSSVCICSPFDIVSNQWYRIIHVWFGIITMPFKQDSLHEKLGLYSMNGFQAIHYLTRDSFDIYIYIKTAKTVH